MRLQKLPMIFGFALSIGVGALERKGQMHKLGILRDANTLYPTTSAAPSQYSVFSLIGAKLGFWYKREMTIVTTTTATVHVATRTTTVELEHTSSPSIVPVLSTSSITFSTTVTTTLAPTTISTTIALPLSEINPTLNNEGSVVLDPNSSINFLTLPPTNSLLPSPPTGTGFNPSVFPSLSSATNTTTFNSPAIASGTTAVATSTSVHYTTVTTMPPASSTSTSTSTDIITPSGTAVSSTNTSTNQPSFTGATGTGTASARSGLSWLNRFMLVVNALLHVVEAHGLV